MAREHQNSKSKSEKETEPKGKISFLGELLSLICRAPFPFNVVGLVLKRIPSPWDNRALAIILIVIGILIIHPFFSPIKDFCSWLHNRVAPGPLVQVKFNNYTGKRATVGEEFRFWISENRDNNRDNAINDIRAMSDGAVTVLARANKTVHIRLPRDKEIRRLYNGGGYLRLCFKIDEADKKEVEDYCSTVKSEGFRVLISDPNKWTSKSIAVWFSKMQDNETKNYLQEDVYNTTRMITDALDFFDILPFKPKEPDPNRIVLNIKVGCYREKDNGKNELILKIVENGDKEDIDEIAEPYENLSTIESPKFLKDIKNRIQKNILDVYPLQGKINHLQEIIPSENKPQDREMTLDIGYSHGVRIGDIFDVLSRDQDNSYVEATITYTTEQKSTANFKSNEIKNKEEYYVKWNRHIDEKK